MLWVTALAQGCADPPSSPTGPRLPVIEGTLIADSLDHIFTITWTVGHLPAPGSRRPDPVEAAEVALAVHLPDGSRAALEPQGEGRFVARAQVRPFESFRLTGTVAQFSIDATTRVPGPLILTLPDTDTTRILGPSPKVTRRFPFSWRAESAGGYFPWPRGAAHFESRLTDGEMFFPSLVDTVAVTILAVDSASAAFYGAGFYNPPRGNIPGVLGVFGSATSVRRVFIWVGQE